MNKKRVKKMNILYNEKNKKIIMYVSYLKKITDYYSENEDFQNLGVEIEGLKSNLNYNWSLNDSQKELLKALENRENNSIHKSTLDKINSNDTKMNIVKELVGLKLFSEILYSERVEYLIKEEEILSKNKPLISIPVEADQYYKKENQEHVLAIKIKREGFEWALKHACLSHFKAEIHTHIDDWKTSLKQAPVRIQWDPEKDIFLNALPYRSIQLGLHQEAVKEYVNNWIVEIKDITMYSESLLKIMQPII